jgi:hypothetical protein
MEVDLERVIKENFGFRRFDIAHNMAWRWRGSYESPLYVPYEAEAWEARDDGLNPNACEMIHAYTDAFLFKDVIIDESVPAFCNYAQLFGRVRMIHLLGLIGYKKASPQIREAMLHDLDAVVRSQAAETLGTLGDRKYVSDLIYTLRNDKDICTRIDACEALGELRDKRALIPLREFFEEARAMIYRKGYVGIYFISLKEALQSMLMIGGELAERTLNEALDDYNPINNSGIHVYQAARRGKLWADVKKKNK